MALYKYCNNSPYDRYKIRPVSKSDLSYMKNTLSFLSSRISDLLSSSDTIDTENLDADIFVMIDSLSDKSDIIGTCAVKLWKRMRPGNEMIGYLHDLVILPRYRKISLARKLLSFVMDYAVKKGCTKFEFTCDESLCAYYESFGFKIDGVSMYMYN